MEFTLLWIPSWQNKMYTIQSLGLTPWSSLPIHIKQHVKEHIDSVELDLVSVIDFTDGKCILKKVALMN
jgi:hypothetical protein